MTAMNQTQRPRLAQEFERAAQDCKTDHIQLATLLARFGVQAHGLVVLIFSLPFLLPIPLPGLSVAFGLVIAASGVGLVFGLPIWLPKWIANRPLPGHTLEHIFSAGSRILRKIEPYVGPRFEVLVDETWVHVLAGLMILLSGLFLFLPLPPGTNFPPALVCVSLALGLLERDGLVILIGMFLFVTFCLLGAYLFEYLRHWLELHPSWFVF